MDTTSLKIKAKQLKSEIYALYLAYRDPRTPWYAKAFAAFILRYVLSPIDLIPDFIPVIGYLDDLVIVPAGIALLIKMIPKEVMEECRAKARSQPDRKKLRNWTGAAVIIIVWLVAAYFVVRLLIGLL